MLEPLPAAAAVDGVVAVALYAAVAGRDGGVAHLEDDVVGYTFRQSFFDVLVLGVVRAVALLVYHYVRRVRRRRFVFLVAGVSVVFLVVKFSFVLTGASAENPVPGTGLILLASSAVLAVAEALLCRRQGYRPLFEAGFRLPLLEEQGLMSDRIVVIAGASSALGQSVARVFSRAGFKVLLLARSSSPLQKLEAEINAVGGHAIAFPGSDLTDPALVGSVANRILVEHGVPDVIVCAVGGGDCKPVEDTAPIEVTSAMAPYLAAFYLVHAFLPCMRERGSGSVALVNSPGALLTIPGAAAHTAACHALLSLYRSLGLELAGTGLAASHVVIDRSATPETAAFRIFEAVRDEQPWVLVPWYLRTRLWARGGTNWVRRRRTSISTGLMAGPPARPRRPTLRLERDRDGTVSPPDLGSGMN